MLMGMRARFHARARAHTQTAAVPEKAKEVSEEARAEAEKLKALGTSILAPVHPRALRARSRSTRTCARGAVDRQRADEGQEL